ncbi:MAG: amino acid deaminase [Xanthomonadales bacterium]|nr:amino acid deaminase [Xanthomonadales bacterium]
MRTHPPLELDDIYAERLPPTVKGLPTVAEKCKLSDIPSLGWSLLDGDLPLPAAVLIKSALQHNLDWMQQFTQRAGVSLCPHGKTTMSPQLFDQQLATGSWGLSAATAAHVRTYRQFGVQRIILANQLVGQCNLELVFDELSRDPDFDFYCLVDSLDGLRQLEAAAGQSRLSRPVQVLLEIGVEGGRTGVRTRQQAVALGRAIRDCAPVSLRGIEGYEGIIAEPDPLATEQRVIELLETMGSIAITGCDEEWFGPGELILSAGGSSFFDLVSSVLGRVDVPKETRVVLRSGCYVTHDSLHFARQQPRMRERSSALWGPEPGLRNALEVWSLVHSVPESHRALCSIGKRDVSFDMELPRPLWWYRPGEHRAPLPVPGDIQVTALNDQHAYLDSTNEPINWRPGDLVGFGIAHPCTTFDKWSLLFQVDDEYRVTGAIRTFF